jgi:hypothetical protein
MSREQRQTFEPIEHYERLIRLRAADGEAFMLRTSEPTRRALHYYERQKEKAEVKNDT